ncbi:hypothetical protein ACH47Z_28375 [Streptomyces sp. NPDC020192]|uniref:hypothetical protein n=1 Tax=Streptomyces sp. NPDC020192 TaxID=3365066 RepID=UPI00379AA075
MPTTAPRRRHRAALPAVSFLAATGLLAGCSTTDDSTHTTAAAPTAPRTSTPRPSGTHAVSGLDGTWQPINSDSPITSLTIFHTAVTTTGALACPGTLTQTTTAHPVLTLHCTTPDPDRAQGTLMLRPDGTALVINWDGPKWGGEIDSLRRV